MFCKHYTRFVRIFVWRLNCLFIFSCPFFCLVLYFHIHFSWRMQNLNMAPFNVWTKYVAHYPTIMFLVGSIGVLDISLSLSDVISVGFDVTAKSSVVYWGNGKHLPNREVICPWMLVAHRLPWEHGHSNSEGLVLHGPPASLLGLQ